MWLSSDRLEVAAAHNVVALELHAAGCHAELPHVVGGGAPYTLEETTCNTWNNHWQTENNCHYIMVACFASYSFLPPAKEVWGQGNIFTSVCPGGVVLKRGVYPPTEVNTPPNQKSGWHASYWNAFLSDLTQRSTYIEGYYVCILATLLYFPHNYRPLRGCGKVMFLHLSVILFSVRWGGALCPGGGLCPGGRVSDEGGSLCRGVSVSRRIVTFGQ